MRFGLQNALEWHPWFAWYPVRVDGEIIWLEWIWRRDVCSDAAAWACAPIWEYDAYPVPRKDCHFICHKASIAGQDVACRGDFDQRGCGQLGRIMGRLGAIEFVKEEALKAPSEGALKP